MSRCWPKSKRVLKGLPVARQVYFEEQSPLSKSVAREYRKQLAIKSSSGQSMALPASASFPFVGAAAGTRLVLYGGASLVPSAVCGNHWIAMGSGAPEQPTPDSLVKILAPKFAAVQVAPLSAPRYSMLFCKFRWY